MAEAKLYERQVKHGGLVVYENGTYWTSKELTGQKVELWVTLKGLEIRKNGKTYDTITDYWKRLSEKV